MMRDVHVALAGAGRWTISTSVAVSTAALIISVGSLGLAFLGYHYGERILVRPGFARVAVESSAMGADAILFMITLINRRGLPCVATGFSVKFDRSKWMRLELQPAEAPVHRFGVLPGFDSRLILIPVASNLNLPVLQYLAGLASTPKRLHVRVETATQKHARSKRLRGARFTSPGMSVDRFRPWLTHPYALGELKVDASTKAIGERMQVSVVRGWADDNGKSGAMPPPQEIRPLESVSGRHRRMR
jgi:hypothetical protein